MKSIIFLLFPVLVFHSNLFAQNSTEGSAPKTTVETQAQPVEQNNTSTSVGVKQAPPLSKTMDLTKTRVMEQTLSIIKPDAVLNRHIGDIIARLENKGLYVIGLKMTQLNPQQAGQFYKIHREKPFYSDLVAFMSSGPIVVMVLEGENAIARAREIMGATDPEKAAEGTIRGEFAQSITKNAIHGSDSPETAKEEIQFFFEKDQIFPRDL